MELSSFSVDKECTGSSPSLPNVIGFTFSRMVITMDFSSILVIAMLSNDQQVVS